MCCLIGQPRKALCAAASRIIQCGHRAMCPASLGSFQAAISLLHKSIFRQQFAYHMRVCILGSQLVFSAHTQSLRAALPEKASSSVLRAFSQSPAHVRYRTCCHMILRIVVSRLQDQLNIRLHCTTPSSAC